MTAPTAGRPRIFYHHQALDEAGGKVCGVHKISTCVPIFGGGPLPRRSWLTPLSPLTRRPLSPPIGLDRRRRRQPPIIRQLPPRLFPNKAISYTSHGGPLPCLSGRRHRRRRRRSLLRHKVLSWNTADSTSSLTNLDFRAFSSFSADRPAC